MSEDRAQQPGPRDFTDFQPATCERCDEPRGRNRRFCSVECFNEWQREGPVIPMTFEEMVTEMEGVFARLATYEDEETTS